MKLYKFLLPLFAATSLFAEEGESVGYNSQGGFMQMMIMISIAMVFFYFILYRPEQKRRKKAETMRNAIKKGDRVTAMGIIGTIAQVKEQTVIVKMYKGGEIEFLKGAITDVQPQTEEKAETVEISSF